MDERKPCALVFDRFSAHLSERTKEEGEKLKIRLVFVPTSATKYYQPLDRRVFGALKSSTSSSYADFAFAEQKAYSINQAADLFLQHWKRLSHNLIRSAWHVIDAFDMEFQMESDCGDQSDDCDSEVLVSDDSDISNEFSSESDEYEAHWNR